MSFVPLSDNAVKLGDDAKGKKGLTDDLGIIVNTATVTATVSDEATDIPVPGVAFPIPVPFVAGSQGNYRGLVPDSADFTGIDRVVVEIIADDGAGRRRRFEFEDIVTVCPP